MINDKNKKPVVLVIAGHDPSGGAGIQADIESIANAGCHAATIITSLTAQDTNTITDVSPQDSKFFKKQINLILNDMDILACKIGMIGNSSLVEIIHNALSKMKIPIVLDPVINSGTGENLSSERVYEKIIALLLPLATIITTNTLEAKILTGYKNLELAAKKLHYYGAKNVLITGTHDKTKNVINRFYSDGNPVIYHKWKRLPGVYHGSGCTLSSRIAANLAVGATIEKAIEDAQQYTWQTLVHGIKIGKGQIHPNRFYEKEL